MTSLIFPKILTSEQSETLDSTRSHYRFNCGNTLSLFLNKDQEKVENLKYFDINNPKNSIRYINLSPQEDFVDNGKLVNRSLPLIKLQGNRRASIMKSSSIIKQGFNNHIIESNYERERDILKDKIENLKFLKNQAIEEKHNLSVEVDLLKNEIEILVNYQNYVDLESSFKNSVDFLKNKLKRQTTKKSNKNEDDEIFLRVKNDFQIAENNRQEELAIKNSEEKVKSERIGKLKSMIEKYDNDMNELRNRISKINFSLIQLYHNILHKGEDSRQDGLSRIIEAIWNCGSEVILSFLPSFLDEEAIIYLFDMAKLNSEYKKLHQELNDFKTLYNQEKQGKSDQNTFKTDVFYQRLNRNPEIINSRIFKSKVMKKTDSNSKFEGIDLLHMSFKQINNLIDNKQQTDEKTLEYIESVKELDQKISEKKNQIQNLRAKELDRINNEFLFKNYSKRFNIEQKKVLSALIGIENSHKIYSDQLKIQREFKNKLKICKTYNLMEEKLDNLIKKSKYY